jgi:hypothetical protein
MMFAKFLIHSASVAVLSITIAFTAVPAGSTVLEGDPLARSLYVVQASTLSAAQQSVGGVEAKVDRKFAIIHAVSAYLTAGQADRLRNTAGVHVFRDRMLSSRCLLGLVNCGTYLALATPASPLITPLIAPLVVTVSTPVPLQDGTGVLLPSLLYQTNYPHLVGADSLQQS